MPNVPDRPEELVCVGGAPGSPEELEERQEVDLGNCVLCKRTLFQVCPSCVPFLGLIFYCPMQLDVNNRLWHDHCAERVNRRRSI